MERMDDDDEVLDRNINGVMVDLFACNPFLEDADSSKYREEIRRRDDAMMNYCCLSMIVCSNK
jgi:DNA-binding MltR family transcriptional regulator